MRPLRQARPRLPSILSPEAFGAGLLSWCLGGLAAHLLHGVADLGSQALPLVLAAAFASVWWPTWLTNLFSVAAVLAFNWFFVAPQGTLHVTLERDLLLLVVMLLASIGVTLLMARQRRLAEREQLQSQRVQALYALSEALRQADDPVQACQALGAVLKDVDPPLALTCLLASVAGGGEAAPVLGQASADERSGLALCLRDGTPMGPGTGVFENQPGWYLPLRGLKSIPGAALVRLAPSPPATLLARDHVQALCDLAGQALERMAADKAAQQARQQATENEFRSTMLAAISHDYRTPLACILGAASSLAEQGERMEANQRQDLARRIVEEAGQLHRLTDNALQLARLGAQGAHVRKDWESLPELLGAVVRRVRARAPGQRLQTRTDPGLPLLHCDAVLIVQMLENLIDNALKYSPPSSRVDVACRQGPDGLSLAVQDRGPGIPPQVRQRLFAVFERGDNARFGGVRGSGIGLALCSAVARVHGASLRAQAREGGGTCMEVVFPVMPAPPTSLAEASHG